MSRIVVCDDDREIVDAIKIYLEGEGYEVSTVYDGDQAVSLLAEHPADLLIMDVMMPKLDGLLATLEIRRTQGLPIILLSAKSEDSDKILGLNAGADDYVTKPFNPLELIARVKSQLRRYTQLGSAVKRGDYDGKADSLIRVGGLEIDDETKMVQMDGELVKLTPIEYQILLFLAQNAGRVFSTQQIYQAVWHECAQGSENTIAVHIRHIREKIEINPADPRYLMVVWGYGYKIEKVS